MFRTVNIAHARRNRWLCFLAARAFAGGMVPTWTSSVVSSTADGALSVYVADVDGDGLQDLLSASTLDGKVQRESSWVWMPGWGGVASGCGMGAIVGNSQQSTQCLLEQRGRE